MTRVGKLLVFLNLFASVGLATWAVSLSANRLDWVDRQDGEKKVEGDITRLKKEIESSLKGIAEVSAVYGQQDRALTAAESGTDVQREGRDPRRKVFAARLKAAEDGRFAEQVRLPNKVLIDVSQESRKPVLGPNGQPLEGVEVYQKRLDDALKDSQTYLKKIADLRARFKDLTDGTDTTPGISTVNKQIEDQRNILASLIEEQRYLAAVQVNWDEELRTLRTRQRQLERRIQQVAGKPPAGDKPSE